MTVHVAGTCGCCEAPDDGPALVTNRPSLAEIRYRIGTYATFREAMLQGMAKRVELAGLTTRRDDDFGVALLDLWAYVCDVLTFYQERLANEAFLRTATQRESVLRLVAALGYRPRAGVAATVALAFALEPGKRVTLPAELRVQSVPAHGQQPQKFETRATLDADAALNRLPIVPAPISAGVLGAGRTDAVLAPGWTPRLLPLAPQDALVFFRLGVSNVEDKTVVRVEHDAGVPRLVWSPPLAGVAGTGLQCWTVRRKLRVFGHDAPSSYTTSAPDAVFQARFTFVTRPASDWLVSGTTLLLDQRYDDLHPGTRLLVLDGLTTPPQLVTVQTTTVANATLPPLAAAATQVTVDVPLGPLDRRTAVVYELGTPLAFWSHEYPGTTVASGVLHVRSEAPLPDALAPKRAVVLIDGTGRVESATIDAVTTTTVDGVGHWQITLTSSLGAALEWRTAALLGNVVTAAHGETVRNEVLGDGDAARTFQRFTLKRKPVAFSADEAAPRGAASEIALRVNGIAWDETPTFFGRGPDDLVFMTTLEPDDAITVRLGDGRTGARVPSGRGNVTARYRQGGGRAGNVGARTITALLDRPTGVKAVSNPDGAQGGDDPESLEDARRIAPSTVRIFDRVVSLSDFADAARDVPGIAKARASWACLDGEMTVRLVTAGRDGQAVTGDLAQRLRRFLDARRDRARALRIETFVPMAITLDAEIHVDPRRIAEDIGAAAERAIRDALSFDALALGQTVNLSDVHATLQGVDGVAYVDVNRLTFTNASTMSVDELRRRAVQMHGAAPAPLQPRLLLMPNELARLDTLALTAVIDP